MSSPPSAAPSPPSSAASPPSAATSAALHVADDPLFDAHHARGHHPERPERLGAVRRGLERAAEAGLRLLPVAPRDATDEEIVRAHDPEYLAALRKLDGHWASLDADTYLCPASVAAARRAAGAAIALVDALLAASPPSPGNAAQAVAGAALAGGPPAHGIAIVRPPGHHATRRTGMGFCLLNNVAIAAHAALDRGLRRVAIVDFDVHHGNGTQDIFWRDPRVLFVSLHQWPFYPGTGLCREVGEGEGVGYNINMPLSEGAGDAVYEAAFDEVVVPVLDEFAPELVLVSAGYDGHERDPLASMHLTAGGYASMAGKLAKAAARSAGGRLGLLLEGGYNLGALEESVLATVLAVTGAGAAAEVGAGAEAAAGAGAGAEAAADPAAGTASGISPRHRAELDRARHWVLKRWSTI